jgi:membrane associated rhomboid family serine protease
VFKVQDETTESALCVGIVAAVVWGIGLSLYSFDLGPGDLSLGAWAAQLVGGIVACLLVPLVFVRGREWVLGKIQQPALAETLERP